MDELTATLTQRNSSLDHGKQISRVTILAEKALSKRTDHGAIRHDADVNSLRCDSGMGGRGTIPKYPC